MTTYAESPAGLYVPRANGRHAELLAGYAAMVELLESRLGQLERDATSQGWKRLGETGGREFSRDVLDTIVDLARAAYLKNPLIRRSVEVGALYVWGQDLSVKTAHDDVKKVVDRFDKKNRATLTGQQASRLLDVELRVTGNVFLALFTSRITGDVDVRPVPVEEMRRIITDPEDRFTVWYYLRSWTEQPINGGSSVTRKALYPDIDYSPDLKPASLATTDGEIEIRWDSPVMHSKSGAFLNWRWGVPEVYAALDWSKAFVEMLEDDATRSRALARFAWRITTEGGKAAVSAAKTKLGTTFGVGATETNPPPTSGSTFVGDKSVGLDPIRIAGATLDPDHSRNARLMVASAVGLPDTILSGDVDQGTLATAKSLDRPTELGFAEDREAWKEHRGRLYQYAIDADLAATHGILPKTITEEDRQVNLSWPDLLEPDVVARVQSVVQAATLGSQSPAGTIPRETTARLLMVAIGVENVDDEIAKLEDEWDDQDSERERVQQQMQQTPEQANDSEREAFVSALKEVREALKLAVLPQ